MSEVNARWERDHREIKRGAAYFAALAAILWIVSYQASFPIFTVQQWVWFAVVSSATLLAAIGCTIGTAVLVGMHLLDSRPLEDANG